MDGIVRLPVCTQRTRQPDSLSVTDEQTDGQTDGQTTYDSK